SMNARAGLARFAARRFAASPRGPDPRIIVLVASADSLLIDTVKKPISNVLLAPRAPKSHRTKNEKSSFVTFPAANFSVRARRAGVFHYLPRGRGEGLFAIAAVGVAGSGSL